MGAVGSIISKLTTKLSAKVHPEFLFTVDVRFGVANSQMFQSRPVDVRVVARTIAAIDAAVIREFPQWRERPKRYYQRVSKPVEMVTLHEILHDESPVDELDWIILRHGMSEEPLYLSASG